MKNIFLALYCAYILFVAFGVSIAFMSRNSFGTDIVGLLFFGLASVIVVELWEKVK